MAIYCFTTLLCLFVYACTGAIFKSGQSLDKEDGGFYHDIFGSV